MKRLKQRLFFFELHIYIPFSRRFLTNEIQFHTNEIQFHTKKFQPVVVEKVLILKMRIKNEGWQGGELKWG